MKLRNLPDSMTITAEDAFKIVCDKMRNRESTDEFL